jgi:hypothetical protein
MDLRGILISSIRMLQERPVLFLPKIVDAIIWSFFWLTAADGITNPASLTPQRLQFMLVFLIAMIPIQVWIYNSYFIIVRQHHEGDIDMVEAFREGIGKLPEGIGAFLIPFVIGSVLAVPGTILFTLGIMTGDIVFQAVGAVLAGIAVLGTGIAFYLSPVSVVLGEGSFRSEFSRGFRSSQKHRREVTIIAVLSVLLLAVTTVLEGRLEQIGTIGFILGRIGGSVINLYLLLVNPTLLLASEE